MSDLIKRTVVEWLNSVDYTVDKYYIPSDFALKFVNFIKLVNGDTPEEHTTPVVHFRMLDQVPGDHMNIVNMCSRGISKTTIMGQYLILYIAVYGEIEGYGDISYALYVSDAIENGVKKMRLRLERMCTRSVFLKRYLVATKFTDVRWYFQNTSGKELVISGHSAKSGVRGTVELGTRPQLAILDDLLSDDDARSPTVLASIEDTVYNAIDFALHPNKKKIIWSGTPFNAKDPLYKAVESGAWYVNVYPICNEYPCEEKDFIGAWPDRFGFKYVKDMYDKLFLLGKISAFNQELMLRIMSEDERLITDSEIGWYKHKIVLQNKGWYNFYITTDFATSEEDASDFSVISVWALNHKGYWFWCDGICKKQLMDKNIDDLFRLAQKWKPQQVGVEVSGQQTGFVTWIQTQMQDRNIWFTLASENNKGKLGIRPVTNKMMRFNTMVPMFKAHMIFFPEEMKDEPIMQEAYDELSLVAPGSFRAKHDDFLDTISMLSSLTVWRPSPEVELIQNEKGVWEMEEEEMEMCGLNSYIV